MNEVSDLCKLSLVLLITRLNFVYFNVSSYFVSTRANPAMVTPRNVPTIKITDK